MLLVLEVDEDELLDAAETFTSSKEPPAPIMLNYFKVEKLFYTGSPPVQIISN